MPRKGVPQHVQDGIEEGSLVVLEYVGRQEQHSYATCKTVEINDDHLVMECLGGNMSTVFKLHFNGDLESYSHLGVFATLRGFYKCIDTHYTEEALDRVEEIES